MTDRMRLGGAADALSLTALGASAVLTAPVFESGALGVGMGLTAAGMAWLASRRLEPLQTAHILGSPLNLTSSKLLSNPEDGILLGYRTDTGKPVYLDEDSVSRHVLSQGGSGYGKTALTKLVALQRMAIGGGFLYVDAKRDQKDVDELYQFAVLTGRVQDMIVVDPGNPSQSHTYNPIADGDEDEIADRILTWIPASTTSPGADHYRQSARQGIATLVGALKALGLAYNFIDLAILIQNQKALQELEDRMRKALPFHPATKNLSLFLEGYKGGFGMADHSQGLQSQINMKRLKETFGGVAGRLHQFGTGRFGAVVNSYSPEFRMFDAIRDNKIVIIRLPRLGKPEAAEAFMKMALADFRTAMAWFQERVADRPSPRFLCLMDEFGAYALSNMDQPFEMGRTSGLSLWALFQSYGQLDKVSPEFKQIVNATTYTKIFFGLGDTVGAEEAANVIGQTTVVKESISSSARDSASTPKVAVAPDGGSSADEGLSISETEELDFRVTPDEVRSLSIGEAIVVHKGGEMFHILIPEIRVEPELAKEIGSTRILHRKTPPVKGCDYFKNSDRYLTSAKAH